MAMTLAPSDPVGVSSSATLGKLSRFGLRREYPDASLREDAAREVTSLGARTGDGLGIPWPARWNVTATMWGRPPFIPFAVSAAFPLKALRESLVGISKPAGRVAGRPTDSRR